MPFYIWGNFFYLVLWEEEVELERTTKQKQKKRYETILG